MSTRLRNLRLKHRLTQAELARLIGTTQQHYQRMEKPDYVLPPKWASKIAVALDVSEDAVVEPKTVPIVGKVGAGARVYTIHDTPAAELERAACPRGMDYRTTVAVIVEGDSMYPEIDEGWFVFYDGTRRGVTEDVLGQRCVVKLSDGAMLLKRIARTGDRYTLLSANARPIDDAEVEWAAPAVALPPYLAAVDEAA